MKCKDCKALVGECCMVIATLRIPESYCPFDAWIRGRDEINSSDRGEIKYLCNDDPNDRGRDCLYGTGDEWECTHLLDRRHPRDCKSSEVKK